MNKFLALLCPIAAVFAVGCAQPREVYIPIYPAISASSQPLTNAPLAPLTTVDTRPVAPVPPPVPQIEPIPPVPSGDYAWDPGHWGWNGTWIWINGRWMPKPYVTARWEPGYWRKHGSKYEWIQGRWS